MEEPTHLAHRSFSYSLLLGRMLEHLGLNNKAQMQLLLQFVLKNCSIYICNSCVKIRLQSSAVKSLTLFCWEKKKKSHLYGNLSAFHLFFGAVMQIKLSIPLKCLKWGEKPELLFLAQIWAHHNILLVLLLLQFLLAAKIYVAADPSYGAAHLSRAAFAGSSSPWLQIANVALNNKRTTGSSSSCLFRPSESAAAPSCLFIPIKRKLHTSSTVETITKGT